MIETRTQPQEIVATYPRVYQISGARRVFLWFLSLLLGAPAAVGCWYFGMGSGAREPGAPWLMVLLCVGFMLLSGFLLAWMLVARVTLWPDRIESRDLFTTRALYRSDILGRRSLQQQNSPPQLKFFPKDKTRKSVELSGMYRFDSEFQRWIADLPDLDEQDRCDSEREIVNNEEIGATPEDRIAALNRGKKISRSLAGVTYVFGLWAWFYPRPYEPVIAVLALLPCLALAITARSGGLFRIDAKRNDSHPNLGIPFMIPGFFLALRVVLDINVLHWEGALVLSVVLGCVLAAVAMLADSSLKKNRVTAILVFVLSVAYGYGAGVQANALLDRSDISVFRAAVISKQIINGKTTTYELRLAPWGPREEPDKVSVSRRFYQSVEVGDSVCLALRSGALRVPWYTVHMCANAATAPEPSAPQGK